MTTEEIVLEARMENEENYGFDDWEKSVRLDITRLCITNRSNLQCAQKHFSNWINKK